MKRSFVTACSAILALTASAIAAEPSSDVKTPPQPQTVKCTYTITGLHCPPCTSTVEKSVKSIKGVQSAKVDWKTKNAQIEFDEQQVTAQQIAERIRTTSHMMGASMHYGSSIVLQVPEIGGMSNADKAKTALAKIPGVSKVTIYPKEKTIGVVFAEKGNVSTTQLIDTLKQAGLEAKLLP